MRRPGVLAFSWMAMSVAMGTAGGASPERVTDLPKLAAGLDLTGAGVRRWLAQLGVGPDRPPTERLLALSRTGGLLMARDGDRSSVVVDAEMDGLLLQPDADVVLLHNHPANVGLSAADLGQLTKRGVAAIVAIAHDGSVFVAAAGPRLDRAFFEARQHGPAMRAVEMGFRAEGAGGHMPAAMRNAQLPHLISLLLAKAGVIEYWFDLRGSGQYSYASRQLFFSRVLVRAGSRLKKECGRSLASC